MPVISGKLPWGSLESHLQRIKKAQTKLREVVFLEAVLRVTGAEDAEPLSGAAAGVERPAQLKERLDGMVEHLHQQLRLLDGRDAGKQRYPPRWVSRKG
jgi:hypothetical protein